MSCIDEFLPRARLRQVDRVALRCTPDQAYAAFRHLDATRFGFVRALFWLREAPLRLAGRTVGPVRVGIDTVADGTSHGFVLLADRPGQGVVVGSVGRFWRPGLVAAEVTPETFASFAEPGWGKLAWTLWAEPGAAGTTIVTFELRVTATDDASWRAFSRYFTVIGPFSHAIRRAVLGHLRRTLGDAETPDPEDRVLASDELVADPQKQITYQVDIAAPAATVWPYLVQMGRWRAGWYSIDRLDNDGVPSEEHVVPGLQDLRIGDVVPTGPGPDDGYEVRRIEPPHALVLGADFDRRSGLRLPPGAPGEDVLRVSWAFVLEPLGQDACRLITRVRGRAESRWTELTYVRLLAPVVHAVMERAQLRGLRRRAERDVLGA